MRRKTSQPMMIMKGVAHTLRLCRPTNNRPTNNRPINNRPTTRPSIRPHRNNKILSVWCEAKITVPTPTKVRIISIEHRCGTFRTFLPSSAGGHDDHVRIWHLYWNRKYSAYLWQKLSFGVENLYNNRSIQEMFSV